MRTKRSFVAALPFIFAVLVFTGCSTVNVKQPAGDKPATLKPEHWEGTWRGADEERCVSRILDPAKGLVEIRSSSPGEKDDITYLVVRELKERLVATAIPDPKEKIPENEGAGFFRIAIKEEHVALFMPVEAVFKEAVTEGTISGTIRKADKKKEYDRDRTILDKFGSAELDKLQLGKKGNLLECFDPDPSLVLIREKKAAGPGKNAEKAAEKK